MYKLNLYDDTWALWLIEVLSQIQCLTINTLKKDWLDSKCKTYLNILHLNQKKPVEKIIGIKIVALGVM